MVSSCLGLLFEMRDPTEPCGCDECPKFSDYSGEYRQGWIWGFVLSLPFTSGLLRTESILQQSLVSAPRLCARHVHTASLLQAAHRWTLSWRT